MYRASRRTTLLARTLVLAMLVPIIAACGGGSGTASPSASSGTGNASPSAATSSSTAASPSTSAEPSEAASSSASTSPRASTSASASGSASGSASARPSASASASGSASASASASGSASASPSASGSGSGGGTTPPASAPAAADSPNNDKIFIAGFNQSPDTLFALESQSAVTTQVLVGTGVCLNQLQYEYSPTYCYDEFPTLENGNAVTETVEVNPDEISEDNPIVVEGTLVTDTAAAEEAGIEIPETLDQLTLTFDINDQLFWEDGVPVTAADAVFAYEVQNDPALQAASTYGIDRIVSVEQPDTYQVVQTYAPGYLDSDYYTTFVGFLPDHLYRDSSLDEIRQTESNKPFSFGPYLVSENRPGEQTTLVNNPYFFDQPNIGTVIYKYVADQDQLLAQLESGDIDYAGTIGLTLSQAPRLDELAAQGAVEVQYVPATVWEHIDFGIERLDGQPSFFGDARVRQAVAYAIDRQSIVDQVLNGKTTVMNTYVPSEHPSYPGDEALEGYEFDQARAQQLLDEAGVTDSNGDGTREVDGREFSVTLYTTEGNATRQATTEIIQQNLDQVGINVELQFVPGTAQLFKNGADGILAGRRFDMALYAWVSGVDPSHLLYTSDQIPTEENGYSGQNNPAYSNPEFDAAARAALTTIDLEQKRELDREPLVIYNRDLPSFPLFQRVSVGAFRTGVTGLQIDPTSVPDLYNIQDIDVAEQ